MPQLNDVLATFFFSANPLVKFAWKWLCRFFLFSEDFVPAVDVTDSLEHEQFLVSHPTCRRFVHLVDFFICVRNIPLILLNYGSDAFLMFFYYKLHLQDFFINERQYFV